MTLRRLQAFAAAPNEVLFVEFALANAPHTVVFWGAIQADASGTITIPDLPFGAAPLVLTVSRVSAGGCLDEYGEATAGCFGEPTIAGNSVPRIGNTNVAIDYGKTPRSRWESVSSVSLPRTQS